MVWFDNKRVGSTTQVVYDFSNSAIALRRQFGAGFTIGRILDLQLAFEALHGRFGADVVTLLRAFGQQVSYSDAAFRYLLHPTTLLIPPGPLALPLRSVNWHRFWLSRLGMCLIYVPIFSVVAFTWEGGEVLMRHRARIAERTSPLTYPYTSLCLHANSLLHM